MLGCGTVSRLCLVLLVSSHSKDSESCGFVGVVHGMEGLIS